jgi:hypothetical protein
MTKLILCLICVLILCTCTLYLITCCAKEYYTNASIVSTTAYVGMRPSYYGYEMPEDFFIEVLREINGKYIQGSIDSFIIARLNDKLPKDEKHKYQILSTEILNETLNITAKQFLIYRSTKAYGIAITINYQTIDDKVKILFGSVDGFIFEDKLFHDSSFSPS